MTAFSPLLSVTRITLALDNILDHCCVKDIESVNRTNRAFHHYITGYLPRRARRHLPPEALSSAIALIKLFELLEMKSNTNGREDHGWIDGGGLVGQRRAHHSTRSHRSWVAAALRNRSIKDAMRFIRREILIILRLHLYDYVDDDDDNDDFTNWHAKDERFGRVSHLPSGDTYTDFAFVPEIHQRFGWVFWDDDTIEKLPLAGEGPELHLVDTLGAEIGRITERGLKHCDDLRLVKRFDEVRMDTQVSKLQMEFDRLREAIAEFLIRWAAIAC